MSTPFFRRAAHAASRALIVPTLALAAACSPDGNGPAGVAFTHDPGPDDDPLVGHFIICKVGTSATFNVTVDGTLTQVTLAAGECRTVAQVRSTLPGQRADVTVEEIVPANAELVSVSVRRCFGLACTTEAGSNPYSRTLTNDNGFEVTFTNRLLPSGQGCTPGYWKQSQHFDSWTAPLAPGALFTAPGFTSPGSNAAVRRGQTVTNVSTQLQALEANQGSLAALTRHAMAALLNAAHPGVAYGMSPAGVVAAYNAALAGGDVEGTKNMFEARNEAGCPLN